MQATFQMKGSRAHVENTLINVQRERSHLLFPLQFLRNSDNYKRAFGSDSGCIKKTAVQGSWLILEETIKS